jgi:chemotaxis protein methyltransferase CheR
MIAAEAKSEFVLSDRDFQYLSELVGSLTGIVLPPQKRNLVYSRLSRRLRALGMDTFAEYCQYLESENGAGEIADMINAITTNLTRFFREDHHFQHLADEVLKPAAKNGRKLRLWSAGCSTGEEPYSIAMTAVRALPPNGGLDTRILATDLDTQVLVRAKAGEYDAEGVEKMPADLVRSSFSRLPGPKDRYKVADNLRAMIRFNQLNLLHRWPMRGPFDAIFCRNVMIYFDRETKEKLVGRFRDMLRPQGVLYIGHSESLLDGFQGLRLIGRTTYVKDV